MVRCSKVLFQIPYLVDGSEQIVEAGELEDLERTLRTMK